MKIHTFNTGRQYSKHGQRIAYAQIATGADGHKQVAYVDADRGLSGMLRLPTFVTNDSVLFAMDHRQMLAGVLLSDEVEQALLQAAVEEGQGSKVEVVIDLTGGVVQSVCASQPVDLLVISYDEDEKLECFGKLHESERFVDFDNEQVASRRFDDTDSPRARAVVSHYFDQQSDVRMLAKIESLGFEVLDLGDSYGWRHKFECVDGPSGYATLKEVWQSMLLAYPNLRED